VEGFDIDVIEPEAGGAPVRDSELGFTVMVEFSHFDFFIGF
jgi:hypothetical protein